MPAFVPSPAEPFSAKGLLRPLDLRPDLSLPPSKTPSHLAARTADTWQGGSLYLSGARAGCAWVTAIVGLFLQATGPMLGLLGGIPQLCG